MFLPDGAGVEALESPTSRLHIGKAAQPHKLIRIGAMAELAKNLHAVLFLPFKEMVVKQRDKFVAATWLERILAQFDDGTTRGIVGLWHVSCLSFSIPPGTCLCHLSSSLCSRRATRVERAWLQPDGLRLSGKGHDPVSFPMHSPIKGKRLLPARRGPLQFIPDKSHLQGVTIRGLDHLKEGANFLCKGPDHRSEIQRIAVVDPDNSPLPSCRPVLRDTTPNL